MFVFDNANACDLIYWFEMPMLLTNYDNCVFRLQVEIDGNSPKRAGIERCTHTSWKEMGQVNDLSNLIKSNICWKDL